MRADTSYLFALALLCHGYAAHDLSTLSYLWSRPLRVTLRWEGVVWLSAHLNVFKCCLSQGRLSIKKMGGKDWQCSVHTKNFPSLCSYPSI